MLRNLKKILTNPNIKENILIKEIDLNGKTISNNVNTIIYGDEITYSKWLLNIIKESFGFIDFKKLKPYEKELKKIYKLITSDNKLNMVYNHILINSLIRKSFYDQRKLTTIKEEILKDSSILTIKNIPDIECKNIELKYPDDLIVKEILDKDNNIKKIDLESLTKEEIIKLAKENPELLTNLGKEKIEVKLSNKTFHYIPYIFSQSSFEKSFFQQILTLDKFQNSDLQVYYNGDKNISSFKIECFKKENKKITKVGLYTPDFLIIKKDLNKVLIIETKGQGFKNEQGFMDRKNYIEKFFIPFNNKLMGYEKFDYLYIEDTLKENEIISLLNDKITNFFKEEK